MKKVIIAIVISIGLIGCAGGGYVMGCKTAEKLVKEETAQIESDYKVQIENYENNIKEYKKQLEELKEQKTTTGQKQGDGKKAKETEEIQETVPVNKEYEFVDFEVVFGPFCTEDDLTTIKNEAARAVSESEYKNIKKITCSEYFIVDPDKGKVQTYARLDKKGVLGLTYSVRYGKPSAAISEYSQADLSDLEEYGRVMDVDSTETVTPYPQNEGNK